jgi:hypothetical protein
MNQKDFLKLTGLAGAALATLPFTTLAAPAPTDRKLSVRVRPVAGKKYSPSDFKFCQRARFRSGAEALRHLKHRRTALLLVGGW